MRRPYLSLTALAVGLELISAAPKARAESLGSTSSGLATPLAPGSTLDAPPALIPMTSAGAHVTYLGRVGPMAGYLITRKRPNGTLLSMPVYVTPEGDHAILGHAYDHAGKDLTALQTVRLGSRLNEARNGVEPGPPLDIQATSLPTRNRLKAGLARAAAFEQSSKALTASFVVGKPTAPAAFLITDLISSEAIALRTMLRPAIAEGAVKLTVIVVANTKEAEDAAIDLLAAKDVVQTWYYDRQPSPLSNTNESRASAKTFLDTNNVFLRSLAAGDAPILAYLDDKGDWRLQRGTPPSPVSFAAASPTLRATP